MANDWLKEFPGSVTVCDPDGIILEMNDKAALGYANDGGRALIGSNLFDCHPEPSRSRLKAIMDTCRENIYTIEKHGLKKLIYQSPWFKDGQYAGFVELSLVIPEVMPHFIREG